MLLGETYSATGKYKKSQDCFEKAVSLHEQHKFLPSWANLSKIGSARAKVMNNEMNINLTEFLGWHQDNKIEALQGWMSRYIGDILLNIDEKHISEVEDWIKKAIEADSRNGMMFHLAKDYALYAELFKRKGDTPKAKENLNKAIEIFKECGADGWVTRTEEQLTSLA